MATSTTHSPTARSSDRDLESDEKFDYALEGQQDACGPDAVPVAVVTEDAVPPDGGYGWVCCIVSTFPCSIIHLRLEEASRPALPGATLRWARIGVLTGSTMISLDWL